jgi:hypothetical protein
MNKENIKLNFYLNEELKQIKEKGITQNKKVRDNLKQLEGRNPKKDLLK